MDDIKFISDITVKKIHTCGGDATIVAAAKVLEPDDGEIIDDEKIAGLINYLMKMKHGSPFEKGYLEFYVHAPIFVFREWHRHRIGFSYNETSARYKELEPIFWLPRDGRPIIPTPEHKSARPHFKPGEAFDYSLIRSCLQASYSTAYANYKYLINMGYAKEVCRACLPVGIYSSCWVSCNPRSLMNFLSLRTHTPEATYVSYPQAEIEEAAKACEEVFKDGWPITWKAFNDHRRVAP